MRKHKLYPLLRPGVSVCFSCHVTVIDTKVMGLIYVFEGRLIRDPNCSWTPLKV